MRHECPHAVGELPRATRGRVCGPSLRLAFAKLLRLFVLCSLFWPAFSAKAETASEDLIGITVQNREVATLLVRKSSERFWLPMDEFARHISVKVASGETAGPVTIETPFGAVDVPHGRYERANGILYIDQKFFEERLNTRFEFDDEAYTLDVEPPWIGRRLAQEKKEVLDELEPEAVPPDYGFATIHGDTSYETFGGDEGHWANTLRATGHAYGGVWQVNYSDNFDEQRRISDAVWMKQLDDRRMVQAGHQTVALHPLLGSIELTGVQGAWSSKPIKPGQGIFYPGALLNRRGQPQRTFSGTGPVGGFAELWIDDRRVARREIGIGGTFEFVDITLPARQSRVELRIFDHRYPTAPVDVITETLQLSDLLLSEGDYTAIAGGGAAKNTFDRFSRETDYDIEASGFGFGRYGITDYLTAEAAIVRDDEHTQVLAGGVVKLTPDAIGSAAIATNDEGDFGYDAELSWQQASWRLLVHSYWDLPDARRLEDEEDDDELVDRRHEALLGYRYDKWLEVGLIGRYGQDTVDERDDRFILPYAVWRPHTDLSIRATPVTGAKYRVDASYRATPDDHFFATLNQDYANLTYTRRLNDNGLALTADAFYDVDEHDAGGALGFTGRELAGLDISWRAAGSYSQDGFGFDGSVRKELTPGVIGFAEASSQVGRLAFRNTEDVRVRVGVNFDLAIADGGVVPSTRRGVRANSGSLAGSIIPGGGNDDLEGIPVLVDGRVAGRTLKGGHFYIPEVEKGNHIVEFDEEGLPIEHVAEKRTVVARVAPGAVTSLNFETQVEYGAAGQVMGPAGKPLGYVPLIVKDASGTKIAAVETNGFGYYRIDNLPPGTYTVLVEPGPQGSATAARQFTVIDDYIFKVDLKL